MSLRIITSELRTKCNSLFRRNLTNNLAQVRTNPDMLSKLGLRRKARADCANNQTTKKYDKQPAGTIRQAERRAWRVDLRKRQSGPALNRPGSCATHPRSNRAYTYICGEELKPKVTHRIESNRRFVRRARLSGVVRSDCTWYASIAGSWSYDCC